MKPKISIIIPVFNRENLIKATIESIKGQTYSDFECLLIDDHSSDNTIEVMQNAVGGDLKFKVIKRQSIYAKGPAGCRNMGLDISTGEYIQFFDSDDLMHPDHLKLKIEAYSDNVDLVVCQLGEFKDNDYERLLSINDIDDKGNLISHITGEVNYYLPGPMWKRKIIGSERFQTDIKIYEDLLFNLINRKKCHKIYLINEPLIYYRRHENSTTGIATKDVEILGQKRLAWKCIYEILIVKEPEEKEHNKKINSIFFAKSCLNFYYLLCQKSIVGSIKQSFDMVRYGSSKKELLISVKLFLLSIVPFFSKKGYNVYNIKMEN